jgi:hypothetical protein
MKKMTATYPPRRNFKTQEDGIKSGRTEQSGYQFKNTTPMPRMSVKHLCTSRPAGREIDQTSTRKAEENNKRYQENPQLYRTRQEINEHIFGTIKTMGLQSLI